MYAAFGCGVGCLANLSIKGSYGSYVDDNAFFSIFGLIFIHLESGITEHVECAHQVNVDNHLKPVDVPGAILVKGTSCTTDTSIVDQDMQSSEFVNSSLNSGFHVIGGSNITLYKKGSVTQFGGQSIAFFFIKVSNDHIGTGFMQTYSCSFT